MPADNFNLARELEQLRDEWFGRRQTYESRLLTRAIRQLRADGVTSNRKSNLESKEALDINRF